MCGGRPHVLGGVKIPKQIGHKGMAEIEPNESHISHSLLSYLHIMGMVMVQGSRDPRCGWSIFVYRPMEKWFAGQSSPSCLLHRPHGVVRAVPGFMEASQQRDRLQLGRRWSGRRGAHALCRRAGVFV